MAIRSFNHTELVSGTGVVDIVNLKSFNKARQTRFTVYHPRPHAIL